MGVVVKIEGVGRGTTMVRREAREVVVLLVVLRSITRGARIYLLYEVGMGSEVEAINLPLS